VIVSEREHPGGLAVTHWKKLEPTWDASCEDVEILHAQMSQTTICGERVPLVVGNEYLDCLCRQRGCFTESASVESFGIEEVKSIVFGLGSQIQHGEGQFRLSQQIR
jgi:hypothetical protein